MLCNFVPVRTTELWQVLARVPDRCGEPQPAGSAEAGEGEPVEVPAPRRGEVVFARVEGAGVEGLERISTFLFHARVRHLMVNGSESYRLTPETAGDELLLRGRGGFVDRSGFSPIPQARTLTLTGAGDGVRFVFFRMQVAEAKHSAPTGSLPFRSR